MSDIVERIRKLRYVHVPVASQLMAEAVTEIERLQEIVSGYTNGISASAESTQPYEENDAKRGVADTDRATLTAEEREAISQAIDAANGMILAEPWAIESLRKLLERLK